MLLNRFLLRRFSSKNVIVSRASPVQIPEISLLDLLWPKLEQFSNKTAIQCFETGRGYTYDQLYQKSQSFASFLRRNFLLHKDGTVGIILGNVPEYPIVMLGAIQAGLKVTTCNPNYTPDEIQRQLQNSDASLLVTSSEYLPKTGQLKLPTIEISEKNSFSNNCISFAEISQAKCEPLFSGAPCHETIVLPFSSGTTGLPKGVQLSHFNVLSTLHHISSPGFQFVLDAEEHQDVVPCFLPFFHIYGMVVVLLNTLFHGGLVIAMPTFTSAKFLTILKEYKPTVIYGPPSTVLLTINNDSIKSEDLRTVRSFYFGGAPLSAADVEQFLVKTQHRVNLYQGYGLTESTSLVCVQSKDFNGGVAIGGSGLLVPNTKLRVVSIDDKATNMGVNEPGELVVQGPQVMSGYHKNPKATRETLLEDSWMRTGDIGYFDENGQIFVTDRLKELIKVKGFQVAPAELEGVLREHPSVEDAGVVGVPHPRLGEAPKAFVVLKKNARASAKDIEEFIAGKLSTHKHLAGGVAFLDAIPKNPSGKILRRDLKML